MLNFASGVEPSIFRWSQQEKKAQGRRVLNRKVLSEVKEITTAKPPSINAFMGTIEKVDNQENIANFASSNDETEVVLQCENDSCGDSMLKKVKKNFLKC